MKIDWIDKLRLFLQTQAFCLVVAAIQYAFQPDRPYEVPLVYSIFIGTSMWLLIDFGRHAFASAADSGWPQGAGAVALPLVSIVVAYFVGTLAADAWFGWSSWDASQAARSKLPVSVLITALAGIVATGYFYSRGRSAYLETQVSEVSRLATESKLKLLEAQIEPHMLFNTLANLRALIATDPTRALTMLDHLNNYLRATLGASRTTSHALQTEFDRLRDYLALMAVRMGPRLRFTLSLPPELANRPVPPLLLQPLVENAIKHGLEPAVAGGEISVRAEVTNGQLVLSVQDTGMGLQGTTVGNASNSHGGSFGLAQVRERLKTLYGDRAGLELAPANPAPSQTGGLPGSVTGTLARIHLPLD